MSDPTFVCPRCGGALDRTPGAFVCRTDVLSFPVVNGIVDFILPERKPELDAFLGAYRAIRAREGWICESREAFERLPEVLRFDPHRGIWRIRRRSMEILHADLRRRFRASAHVLDAGCGNGWLSFQLLKSGYQPIAVDISDDRQDGLGVLPTLYGEIPFPLVKAEFRRLPFSRGSFDAVIFNASLHYSDNPEEMLLAVRDLVADGGYVYVLDSPEFRFREDGEAMMRERREDLQRRHGIEVPFPGQGYLLSDMLRVLSSVYAVERHQVRAGVERWLSRMLTKVMRGRDAAQFPFLVFRKEQDG